MKIIFTLWFGFLLVGGLLGQIDITTLRANFPQGNLYAAIKVSPNTAKDSIYLALIPPVFKDTIIQVEIIEKLDNGIGVEYETITKFYESQSAAYKWIETIFIDSMAKVNCIKDYEIENYPYLILSLSEEPAKYDTVNLKVTKSSQGGDKPYFEYKSIHVKRKVSDGKVRVLSKKDEILHPKQVTIAIPNGKWSPFKEVLCLVKIFEPSIGTIQKALNQKGYKCQITGEINEETRKALVQFQKDNNFPSCGNSYELFKLLGLSVGF
jgi:hypothetical protein